VRQKQCKLFVADKKKMPNKITESGKKTKKSKGTEKKTKMSE